MKLVLNLKENAAASLRLALPLLCLPAVSHSTNAGICLNKKLLCTFTSFSESINYEVSDK